MAASSHSSWSPQRGNRFRRVRAPRRRRPPSACTAWSSPPSDTPRRRGSRCCRRAATPIDAAVATSFALGVTEPYHSGIGGGGFLLIRLANGEVIALDARETAPAAATRDMFVAPGVAKDASRAGPLAVATPSLLAGLALALERWGTKSLAEVMAPAIALAEDGFPISLRHARVLEAWKGMGLAARFPETAAIQLPPPGVAIAPGWMLRQPELARDAARDRPRRAAALLLGAASRRRSPTTCSAAAACSARATSPATSPMLRAAAARHLSRLRGVLVPAAVVGRRRADRDAEHPRGLRSRAARRGLVGVDPPHRGVDEARLRRSRRVSRRSRFRRGADRAADREGLRREAARADPAVAPRAARRGPGGRTKSRSTSTGPGLGRSRRFRTAATTHLSVTDARGQRRRDHADREPALRFRHHRARHRHRAERRDGRLLGRAEPAERLRSRRRERHERRRARQAAALQHDADAGAAGRQGADRGRLARRPAHHHHRAARAAERARLRSRPVRGDRAAALPSPVGARRALDRSRACPPTCRTPCASAVTT